MKILLVNTFEYGGAAKACIRLHLGLLAQGIDSNLLILHKTRNDIPKCFDFKSIYSNYNRFQILKQRFLASTKHRTTYKKISNLPRGIEAFRFPSSNHDITLHPLFQEADVINLHWVATFLDWSSFFTKCNKPIVWTLHDMLPFTGGYHYELGFPMEAYQSLIESNLNVKKKAIAGKKINIVSLSAWLLNKSMNSSTFSHLPHHLIRNGLNDAVFRNYPQELARAVFNLPLEKKVLLFVADSTTNKRKGFSYLLQAMTQLKEEAVIVAVGHHNADDEYTNQIQFLGPIQDERLMALAYSAADVFVIPSIEDNLPNTVLESLSCGTPVVGFPIGGIPDMVQHGVNGFLADSVCADALATTIDLALNTTFDKDLIRSAAVRTYGLEVQAQRYVGVYQSLLGPNKTQSQL
jgi:glycosyltransferase involved in cell wall biosynthesis